jgi:hypothetical protein
MYYNGNLNEVIHTLPKGEDIEYIEWDFPYMVYKEKLAEKNEYFQYAQIPALNDFYYKHNQFFNYCIFCDVDEYMYLENQNLKNYLQKNNPSSFYVKHCWAKLNQDKDKFLYDKYASFHANPLWRAKSIRPGINDLNKKIFEIPIHSGNNTLIEDIIMFHIKPNPAVNINNCEYKPVFI